MVCQFMSLNHGLFTEKYCLELVVGNTVSVCFCNSSKTRPTNECIEMMRMFTSVCTRDSVTCEQVC